MQRYCSYLVIMILLATGPVYAVAPNGIDTALPWSPISSHLWLAGSSRETTGPVGNLSKMEQLEWRIGTVVAGGELCGYYSKAAKVSSFMAISPYFKKGIAQSGRFDFATGCGSYVRALDNLIGRKKEWETYLAATYSGQDTSTPSEGDRGQTAAPPVIDAQTLMNDRGFFRALNKATDKQYHIEIERLDSVEVRSKSGNQARVVLKYLWANDNDRQRVGRGEATVRSIGGQFEVTEFKSLFPTPSQLLRVDAGASGL